MSSNDSNNTDLQLATAGMMSSLLVLDLPSEVFPRLLSFLDFSEHLELTLVFNKRVLEEIEKYHKRIYETIKQEHRVNETFDARVGDLSNIQTTITKRNKPIDLPYRYRKTVAMKTFLYRIAIGGTSVHDIPSKIVLSPLEGRILIIGSEGSTLQVCSVSATVHEPIDTLIHEDAGIIVKDAIFLDHNRILTRTSSTGTAARRQQEEHDSLLLWTRSSEASRRWSSELFPEEGTPPPPDHIMDWIRNENEIILIGGNPAQLSEVVYRYSFDGTLSMQFEAGEGVVGIFGSTRALGVSDNKWLVCFARYRGYRIFNLETNQAYQIQADILEDCDLVQAIDCSRTFFRVRAGAGRRSRLVVFHLGDDGHLSVHSSFPIEGHVPQSPHIHIVEAMHSKFLFKWARK